MDLSLFNLARGIGNTSNFTPLHTLSGLPLDLGNQGLSLYNPNLTVSGNKLKCESLMNSYERLQGYSTYKIWRECGV